MNIRLFRQFDTTDGLLPLWSLPLVYAVTSFIAGVVLPRLEHAYVQHLTIGVSVDSTIAFLTSVSSSIMSLTGLVFAIAFLVVQFSAVAYSPRLVVMFANDPKIYHTLGIFFSTFTYSLATLLWTNRSGSGQVPLLSSLLVGLLLFVSIVSFALMVRRVSDMQIQAVLTVVGQRGREVIAEMYRTLVPGTPVRPAGKALPPPSQTIVYRGPPRAITRFDNARLFDLAREANATIVLDSAVGDTLLIDTVVMRVHGGQAPIDEYALMACVQRGEARTYEQDPKYALRLLVDIAIRALSPAVNDPTTAVQALDQIEDLLRRLSQADFEVGEHYDASGTLRVFVPLPSWEDFLSLAFDEIRQYGMGSVQVQRRLRAALAGLADVAATEERRQAAHAYALRLGVRGAHEDLDEIDRAGTQQEDRQGLGMPRKRVG